MSTIISCLLNKAVQGRISEATVKSVTKVMDDLKKSYGVGADGLREMQVAKEVWSELNDRLLQKTRQVSIHADLVNSGIERITTLHNAGVPLKHIAASFGLGDEPASWKYGYLGKDTFAAIDYHTRMFLASGVQALDVLKNKKWFAIFRGPENNKEILRELFVLAGKDAPTEASAEVKGAAKLFLNLTTKGGNALRKAGVDLRLNKSYLLGYNSDVVKVGKESAEQWARDMFDTADLDLIKQHNPELSTDAEILEMFRQEYAVLVSGGLATPRNMTPAQIRNLANKRANHRIFQPKNFDAYVKYHEKYGEINMYQAYTNYARNVGRDLGVLETLGPKPESFVENMISHINIIDPIEGPALAHMMREHAQFNTGAWIGGVLSPTIARNSASARAILTSAKLGRTFWQALLQEPFVTKAIALKLRGLPVMEALADQISLLANPSKRSAVFQELAETGAYLEAHLTESEHAMRTYAMDGGHKIPDQLAQGVLKYTGLNVVTHSTKASSIRRMTVGWAKNSWEQVAPSTKEWLQNHGITQVEYSKVRDLAIVEGKYGVKMIDPKALFDAGEHDLGIKVSKLNHVLSEMSAPTTNPQLQAVLKGFERRGKTAQIGVGILRTFIGYPGSWAFNQLRQVSMVPGAGRKMAIAGAMLINTAITAVALRMIYDALDGKKPDLNEHTIMKALGNTNIIPYLSDFLIQKAGGETLARNPQQSVLGAHVDAVVDLLGAAGTALSGKPRKALSEVQKVAEGYTPLRNVWFAKKFFDEWIFNPLDSLANPDFHKSVLNKMKKANKEGTPYLWRPGAVVPGE